MIRTLIGVWHREEAKRCDAVNDPGGGSRPHLPPSDHCRPESSLLVIDDVLGAQGLVGAWLGVVGCCVQSLRHVAVWLGLAAQKLSTSFSQQLGELVFGWSLEGAEEEEETAVEERRKL